MTIPQFISQTNQPLVNSKSTSPPTGHIFCSHGALVLAIFSSYFPVENNVQSNQALSLSFMKITKFWATLRSRSNKSCQLKFRPWPTSRQSVFRWEHLDQSDGSLSLIVLTWRLLDYKEFYDLKHLNCKAVLGSRQKG